MKVLIISPHFPPVNAADMHRVRQMLNYLPEFGWNAEVVAVDPQYIEAYSIDHLLLQTIPSETIVHYVKAWRPEYTRKFGLGSLSMRSYSFVKKKVNQILLEKKIDLIFFSTTAFHVMALGPYWKKKFGIPFVLDIQDPWRSDFYLKKPVNQRPKKFWISYSIDKYLEKKTIPFANAIIAVSQSYINTFKCRYKNFQSICRVIPFAIDEIDFDIAHSIKIVPDIVLNNKMINVVYIGRGGHDLEFSVDLFFKALKKLEKLDFKKYLKIKCYFIGTSYAQKGQGKKTISPISEKYGLENQVIEITDRVSYFSTLYLLRKAHLLFVPGSIDEGYTASKIYPYVLAKKPLIAIFNEHSSVIEILKKCTNSSIISFSNDIESQENLVQQVLSSLIFQLQNIDIEQPYDAKQFRPYMAKEMTRNVVEVFNNVITNN